MNRKSIPKIVLATIGKDEKELGAIIANGANVNDADKSGRTALHHAAINGDARATEILLNAGASVDAADSDGWTPLHFAARGHEMDVAKLLVNAGAKIDAEDSHGNTPLFRAVFESRGRGEMITFLRQHGAEVSRKNRHGMSPKDLAESIANYDVKKWLA